jgi:hypothetical protein
MAATTMKFPARFTRASLGTTIDFVVLPAGSVARANIPALSAYFGFGISISTGNVRAARSACGTMCLIVPVNTSRSASIRTRTGSPRLANEIADSGTMTRTSTASSSTNSTTAPPSGIHSPTSVRFSVTKPVNGASIVVLSNSS